MTPAIQQAISEVQVRWPEAKVTHVEDGGGNVTVFIDPIEIGDQYVPSKTWIGFTLQAMYPDADVYPHFISGQIVRADGKEFGESFGKGHNFHDKEAIQVSRRTNDWNGAVDSAETKLIKVVAWIKSRT